MPSEEWEDEGEGLLCPIGLAYGQSARGRWGVEVLIAGIRFIHWSDNELDAQRTAAEVQGTLEGIGLEFEEWEGDDEL